jgi:hypothetical protein
MIVRGFTMPCLSRAADRWGKPDGLEIYRPLVTQVNHLLDVGGDVPALWLLSPPHGR